MGSEVAIRSTALTLSGLRDEISRGSLVYPNRGAPDPMGSEGSGKAFIKACYSELPWMQWSISLEVNRGRYDDGPLDPGPWEIDTRPWILFIKYSLSLPGHKPGKVTGSQAWGGGRARSSPQVFLGGSRPHALPTVRV